MAPRRGRRGHASADESSNAGRRRDKKAKASPEDEASRAYREMLSEAARSPASTSGVDRPAKRRKTTLSRADAAVEHVASYEDSDTRDPSSPVEHHMQTTFDDSMSSDASDIDWEQVDLDDNNNDDDGEEVSPSKAPTAADNAIEKDISIDLNRLNETPSKRTTSRRLPTTAVEKKKRIQIHKIHLCCLLTHVYIRNHWCNDESIQAILKPLLTKKQIAYLNPDSSLSQFQRSRSFVDGLEQACEVFRPAYRIRARGLKRPTWIPSIDEAEKPRPPTDTEEPIDKDDFLTVAQELRGSRDAGVQLFCALLRSAGVDTRLVCSLQPLPFATAVPAPTQKAIDSKPTVIIRRDGDVQSADEATSSDREPAAVRDGKSTGNGLKPVKRFGASSSSAIDLGVPPPSATNRKKIIESPYPVYWVEAFNSAIQKWLPVDPLVTKTVAKPQKFEPPASDSANDMVYVIAFEDDGTAKDVTRRYSRAYNAKTRRARIESTKGGSRWWKRVMKAFDLGFEADRDQVEDAELLQREASEPMPRNVQDFKDHPYYALERHLRRNEVIHPKKEVGKLSGTKTSDVAEPIYRRRDVQIVKSADKWFRAGREIKAGEQPVKYSSSSRRQRPRSPSPSSDHHEDDQDKSVGLYAAFQTDVYVPPAVVEGRVPRNAFGNLDVHVPSMIPPGGVHVRAPEAAKAARLVGVDYAEAVTGFKFKGRHGTAITQGVVVACEFAEAVEETVLGLRWLDELAAREKNSKLALSLWKRYLVGLRIRERVMTYGTEEDDKGGGEASLRSQVDEAIVKDEEYQEQGGFLPDRTSSGVTEPPISSTGEIKSTYDETEPPADLSNFENEQNPASDNRPMCVLSPWDAQIQQTQTASHESPKNVNQVDADEGGGGFVLTSGEVEGGGFVVPTNDEGGGFVIPTESEDGGGFVVPEHREKIEIIPRDSQQIHDEPEGELDSGKRHQRDDELAADGLEVSKRSIQGGQDTLISNMDHGSTPAVDSGQASVTEATVLADHMQATGLQSNKKNPVALKTEGDEQVERDDNQSDLGSLLSHDPEDEDAEPEWLADDVGLGGDL